MITIVWLRANGHWETVCQHYANRELPAYRENFQAVASPLPVETYYDAWVGNRTVAFIHDQAASRQPWYLFVGFPNPHPEQFAQRQRGAGGRAQSGHCPEFDGCRHAALYTSRQNPGHVDVKPTQDYNGVKGLSARAVADPARRVESSRMLSVSCLTYPV